MQTVYDPYGQNRVQRGGEYTFDGITGYSSAGVPIDARTAYDNCANDFRPAPAITMPVFSGGARKKSRKSRGRRSLQRSQRGGGCGCMGSVAPMRGGGSGNGGFGVVLSNANGKVYDSLSVGACPPPQVGGSRSQVGGGEPVYSYPAGYTYGPKSVVEAGNGTAHYIDPIGYGSIMTGGRRKKSRKSRKSSKKSRKASKKSRKASKKSRKH
jgi:hypothetical protein